MEFDDKQKQMVDPEFGYTRDYHREHVLSHLRCWDGRHIWHNLGSCVISSFCADIHGYQVDTEGDMDVRVSSLHPDDSAFLHQFRHCRGTLLTCRCAGVSHIPAVMPTEISPGTQTGPSDQGLLPV